MKQKTNALLTIFLFLLVACNSSDTPEATIPESTDKVLAVRHPVADYDKWKQVFDGHDSTRNAYGISTIALGRGIEDPNQVVIYFRLADVDKAKEFSNTPELKAIMDSAGVTAAPTFEFVNTVRNDTSQTDIKDRVLVKHKVKDFDAWLKAFDEEGMSKRKSFGVIDRAIARGMDDPNMVYIVFAISDWEKANARMQSEELKKIMTDAGVEGEPTSFKYKLQ